MDASILLAVIAVLPLLLALFLRVSGVFMFLSVAAGSLMVLYLGDDAGLALGMVSKASNVNVLAQLLLLLLPVVLSFAFLRHTLPKSKVLLHLPLLVATGMTLAVLAIPLLGSASQQHIFNNHYGSMLRESQDLIVGAAAIMALLIMWLTYRHKGEKKLKKHR